MNRSEWKNLIELIAGTTYIKSEKTDEVKSVGSVHYFTAPATAANTILSFAKTKYPKNAINLKTIKRNNTAEPTFTYMIYVAKK
jgi:hypothetical protein